METVKNEVIVRLNEFVNVKLAKISKSRRAQAKTDRTAAKYILDNMDNRDALAQVVDNESKEKTLSQELMVVLFDRIKQLDAVSAKAIAAVVLSPIMKQFLDLKSKHPDVSRTLRKPLRYSASLSLRAPSRKGLMAML